MDTQLRDKIHDAPTELLRDTYARAWDVGASMGTPHAHLRQWWPGRTYPVL